MPSCACVRITNVGCPSALTPSQNNSLCKMLLSNKWFFRIVSAPWRDVRHLECAEIIFQAAVGSPPLILRNRRRSVGVALCSQVLSPLLFCVASRCLCSINRLTFSFSVTANPPHDLGGTNKAALKELLEGSLLKNEFTFL